MCHAFSALKPGVRMPGSPAHICMERPLALKAHCYPEENGFIKDYLSLRSGARSYAQGERVEIASL